jgi:NAD(P)-dependent dehydrogenase (short-subunit alcohol dehydrogenase family)
MIDVNLTGVWRTCKAVMPSMKAAGRGGSIIITSSVLGLRGIGNVAHYVAAKHGVVGLMRALAAELAGYNIRVNTINPINVDTGMIHNPMFYGVFMPDNPNPTRADAEVAFGGATMLPIPWVQPSDISNAVLFLASDEARYITAVALPIDAGGIEKFGG